MKKYLVGGAVRDRLRGQTPRDFDYVIVDANDVQFSELTSKMYRVSKSYDVFQDAQHHEYTFTHCLYEDLLRRDFTCNAIAQDSVNQEYIDIHGGINDIQKKIVRMVSSSNIEHDSVRALRGYRMLTILSEVNDYAYLDTVTSEVLKTFTSQAFQEYPERSWTEIHKGVTSDLWFVMFAAMNHSGWTYLHPMWNVSNITDPDVRAGLLLAFTAEGPARTEWSGYKGQTRWQKIALFIQELVEPKSPQEIYIFLKKHRGLTKYLPMIESVFPHVSEFRAWNEKFFGDNGEFFIHQHAAIHQHHLKGAAISNYIDNTIIGNLHNEKSFIF